MRALAPGRELHHALVRPARLPFALGLEQRLPVALATQFGRGHRPVEQRLDAR